MLMMYAGLVNDIMDWEGGQMDQNEEVAFFQKIKDCGVVYELQGCYQRTLRALEQAGLVF